MDLRPYRKLPRRRHRRSKHNKGTLALAGLVLFIFIALLPVVLWLINGTKHGVESSMFDSPQ
jgi:uncharacterized protein involved in exopolysaccharide biosynthesis